MSVKLSLSKGTDLLSSAAFDFFVAVKIPPRLDTIENTMKALIDDRASLVEYEKSITAIAAHRRKSSEIFRNEKSNFLKRLRCFESVMMIF